MSLYDEHLIKSKNCRLIPASDCVKNGYNLHKAHLDNPDVILKSVLWREEKDCIQGKRKVGGDLKFSKWFVIKQKLKCHATWCNNRRTDKGSMQKWNPGRRNITEKRKRKSNEKGGSDCIVDERGVVIGEIERGIEKNWKRSWIEDIKGTNNKKL